MSNFLPNPTREAMCKYPIDAVKDAIRKLPEASNKTANIVSESNAMNTFKFECQGTKLLSMGMFLDFSLHEVSGTHTLVQLQCRRRAGAIDNSVEYSECIDYMVGTYNLLGKLLDGTFGKP